MSTMKLGATAYIRNTLEAVPFYMEAFGLALGYHEMFPNGAYMHAALEKDGEEIFCVSENRNDAFVDTMHNSTLQDAHPTMSYGLNFESAADVKHAYTLLSKEGTVLLPLGSLPWSACCAEVIDQYGVYWYIAV